PRRRSSADPGMPPGSSHVHHAFFGQQSRNRNRVPPRLRQVPAAAPACANSSRGTPMSKRVWLLTLLAATCAASAFADPAPNVAAIQNVVVIYAENRSFDNLYGAFPGANGLQNATAANYTQLDRDGSVMKELPPVWDGLTAKGVTPAITQAQTAHLPNQPFG